MYYVVYTVSSNNQYIDFYQSFLPHEDRYNMYILVKLYEILWKPWYVRYSVATWLTPGCNVAAHVVTRAPGPSPVLVRFSCGGDVVA